MPVITPQIIATALKSSAGWARAGLTAPRADLRFDSYKELSEHVYRTLFQPVDVDRDQLNLPL